jgi:CHAD domain-containing protein
LDGETDCQVVLLKHLGGERQKQAGKLHNLVGKKSSKLKQQLRRVSGSLDKTLQNAEPHPASLAAAESLRLSSELENPKRLNRSNLHAYRLKLKQLRDVLELAPDRQKFVDDLGDAKNAIGEWHDWEELIAIANEVLDHGQCKLMRKLKETADSKFAHAHRVTENLRRTYLKRSSPARKGPGRVELRQDAMAASASLSQDIRRAS